jgi:tRNA threonylcarbamoyladenosine biosynthesis protein TsaB
MYILHIETSTSNCSIALSLDQSLMSCHDMKEGMNHTAKLAPAIQALLLENGIGPKDLGAIAVSSGPGSYTGLRVGSSTGKAMAYSIGIPLIAVPTLSALAWAVFNHHPEADFALPMIDARRKEVFASLTDRSGKEVWPVSSVILEEEFFKNRVSSTGRVIACGDGALKIGDMAFFSGNIKVDATIQASARHMIIPAWDQLQGGRTEDPLHFVPYYLKPPNITQPKKAGMEPL